MKPIVVRCPAKVNLHLEVLGLRADGYHEVRTLMAAVGLWDELVVFPSASGAIEVAVEGGVAVPEDNTVRRAGELLARHFGVRAGAKIVLAKGIPVAAGLGGGSADGAAALVGLAHFWGLDLPRRELAALAAALGSDVPFFLEGGACWAEGRGEIVYPLPDLPPLGVVLVPGREPVPTPAVYRAWDEGHGPTGGLHEGKVEPEMVGAHGFPRAAEALLYDWLVGGGRLPWAKLRNDLQQPAVGLFPWIGEHLRRLETFSPLLAMVSGSGGTVFGIFASQAEARNAAGGVPGAVAVPVLTRKQSRLVPKRKEDACGNHRGAH